MNFNIRYKVKDCKFWDNNIELNISVITESEIFNNDMLINGVDKIKLYDTNMNWFLPKNSVDIIHVNNDKLINLGKFIRYKNRDGDVVATVVFSKNINHNDMNLFIHKLSFKNSLHWILHSAGFINNNHFYGKSETLKLDAEGYKI